MYYRNSKRNTHGRRYPVSYRLKIKLACEPRLVLRVIFVLIAGITLSTSFTNALSNVCHSSLRFERSETVNNKTKKSSIITTRLSHFRDDEKEEEEEDAEETI